MDLSLQKPGNHLFIRSVSEAGIQVVDRFVTGPLILSPAELRTDWEISHCGQLTEDSLGPVFALQPEIVLLGTGAVQVFPPPELMMCFHRRGIGIEVMTTAAACRTFNVLVADRRRVVAALLPPGLEPEAQSMNGNST
jgi:uncharacterized protein